MSWCAQYCLNIRCLGSDQEEVHYKYQLTVIHGKSEYSYKGPVISLMRSANEVRYMFSGKYHDVSVRDRVSA